MRVILQAERVIGGKKYRTPEFVVDARELKAPQDQEYALQRFSVFCERWFESAARSSAKRSR
ncbi:MAG: hypothetical protein WA823_12865 [Candidatus Acidiferrales bacterium]